MHDIISPIGPRYDHPPRDDAIKARQRDRQQDTAQPGLVGSQILRPMSHLCDRRSKLELHSDLAFS